MVVFKRIIIKYVCHESKRKPNLPAERAVWNADANVSEINSLKSELNAQMWILYDKYQEAVPNASTQAVNLQYVSINDIISHVLMVSLRKEI